MKCVRLQANLSVLSIESIVDSLKIRNSFGGVQDSKVLEQCSMLKSLEFIQFKPNMVQRKDICIRTWKVELSIFFSECNIQKGCSLPSG